jgi:cytochrome b pre-mRNA-processing protein 3
MVFGFIRRSRSNARLIDRLHGEIMAAVRQASLYNDYGIADSFEGRFEVLALLASAVVRRLQQCAPPGPDLAQDLTDALFRHFDIALREIGVGDLSVPKRIKALAEAYLGRAKIYGAALAEPGESAIAAALARNVFGMPLAAQAPQAIRLAHYLRAVEAALAAVPLALFERGPVVFPAAATHDQESVQ